MLQAKTDLFVSRELVLAPMDNTTTTSATMGSKLTSSDTRCETCGKHGDMEIVFTSDGLVHDFCLRCAPACTTCASLATKTVDTDGMMDFTCSSCPKHECESCGCVSTTFIEDTHGKVYRTCDICFARVLEMMEEQEDLRHQQNDDPEPDPNVYISAGVSTAAADNLSW